MLRGGVLAMGAVAALALGACGRVIANAPPRNAPVLAREVTVPNSPIIVAGRGARALYSYQFITRRFGRDSTWGFRASDSTHARFRYRPTVGDSTRVLLELWGGRCAAADRACLQADFAALLTALVTEDPPPS